MKSLITKILSWISRFFLSLTVVLKLRIGGGKHANPTNVSEIEDSEERKDEHEK